MFAEVLPADKARHVKQLQYEGKRVEGKLGEPKVPGTGQPVAQIGSPQSTTTAA